MKSFLFPAGDIRARLAGALRAHLAHTGLISTVRRMSPLWRMISPGHKCAVNVNDRKQWIEELRKPWFDVVRPFDRSIPIIFPEARTLEKKHLQNCHVVPSRITLLEECLPKGGTVAELGTLYGHWAKEILHITKPKELHLIDLSFDSLERVHFADAINAGQVYLHQSDSAQTLQQFPDHYFDWIYIDADHSYRGVKRDIDTSIRKVKPDGFLVFNDYIYWSHFELLEYGVVHAVNELCIEGGYEILFFALDTLMYCDVVLRKME